MSEVLRALLWQGVLRPGAEWCELSREADGWRIGGTSLVAEADEPYAARYDIALGEDWVTREVRVALRQGAEAGERRLLVRRDGAGHWLIERDPVDPVASDDPGALRGLIDIDLGFSPATNTLPIRRLAPSIGEGVDVTAVWVRFPELTIEPLPQRYARLAERRYRYESAGGEFVAEIAVDDLGLVVSYEGGWQRIAEATAARDNAQSQAGRNRRRGAKGAQR